MDADRDLSLLEITTVYSIDPSVTSLVSRPRSRSRDSGDENEPIQERFFRPHFLQAPGDLTVQEGKLCRMDCKVSVSVPAACTSVFPVECKMTPAQEKQTPCVHSYHDDFLSF